MLNRAGWVAAGLVALLSAFAVGRYTATPPEVHESEAASVTVQQWSRTVYKHEASTTRVVVRDHYVAVDGSVHDHEEEREASHEVTTSDATAGARTDGVTLTTRDVAPALPAWSLSLLAGASSGLAPVAVSPLFGVGLDHRFAGPFSLGGVLLVRPTPLEFALLGKLSVAF